MEPKSVCLGHGLSPSRIQDWRGRDKRFPEVEQLVHLAEHGVPVSVASGGDLALALRYSNHSSADLYVAEVTTSYVTRSVIAADLAKPSFCPARQPLVYRDSDFFCCQ